MTLININRKGGDAYGKIPKRIAIAPAAFLEIRGAGGVMKEFAKGKKECLARAKRPFTLCPRP
jgi:hypothetical protein